MKTGPLLVVNLLLIAGAIYLYDATRSSASASTDTAAVDSGLQADDLHDPLPPSSAEAPMLGATVVDLEMVRSMQEEIDDLRGELARFKRDAVLRSIKRDSADGSNAGGESSLPAMDLDVGSGSEPAFNEETLKSLELYVDEVNRRKAVERQKTRIQGQIERLDLGLTDQENESVVAATLAFQQSTTKLYRSGWAKDQGGRDERKAAYQVLHEEYLSKISTLVPSDAADKIKSSRIARSRGFNIGGTNKPRKANRNR